MRMWRIALGAFALAMVVSQVAVAEGASDRKFAVRAGFAAAETSGAALGDDGSGNAQIWETESDGGFEVAFEWYATDVIGLEVQLTSFEYDLEVDGGKREYEARIVKSKDDEALVIVRDVTAVKRLEREEELRRVRDELEGRVEKEMLGKNPYGLTFREFTVLHLAANGAADKAVAEQLGISSYTVGKHIARILLKMNAASRTEACVRAVREGFLS